MVFGFIMVFLLFLISNEKDVKKRKRKKRKEMSPEYTRGIHQGQSTVKCLKYKCPLNYGLKK